MCMNENNKNYPILKPNIDVKSELEINTKIFEKSVEAIRNTIITYCYNYVTNYINENKNNLSYSKFFDDVDKFICGNEIFKEYSEFIPIVFNKEYEMFREENTEWYKPYLIFRVIKMICLTIANDEYGLNYRYI